MTVLSPVTRVRAGADGQLTAECCRCRLHLEQLPGTDVEQALSALDRGHAAGAAQHDPGPPTGWRPVGQAEEP